MTTLSSFKRSRIKIRNWYITRNLWNSSQIWQSANCLSYLLMAWITSFAVELTVSSDTLFECSSNFLCVRFFLLEPFSVAAFFSRSSALRSGRDNFFVEKRFDGCRNDLVIDINSFVDEICAECREFKWDVPWWEREKAVTEKSSTLKFSANAMAAIDLMTWLGIFVDVQWNYLWL